ncbi:hypothetical protein EXIGLDRAFT_842590 [Exidia glandulosa HHB12029]|uniref:Uncharacterized protein n=1 Tax=Exidia glandulosa HHB12029 TaxID=1314781 RepID=A0A165D6X2_EXIGL|nr:hypothetical protein EXIGLDRAFT_842590 [Exidia glandulosa HHB12029]
MRLSIALGALAVILAVPAYGFQAFSGSACDGAAGANVACDGSCHAFDNRHSFRADTSGNAHCVAFFVNGGCGGQRFNFTGQAAQCTNVNTGTNIRSFRCFSGGGC